MTADTEPRPQDAKDEESRVLEFIATCPEGASYFTVTTELGIARTRAVSILEQLHRDGRLSYDCKTKMYYPRPEKGPDPAPSMTVLQEPKKCQYCGNIVEKYLWQHEQFCKENPNARKPGQKAKKKEELVEALEPSSASEQEPMIVPIVEAPSVNKEPPEPVPIDDTVPPMEQSIIPECGEEYIIVPPLAEDSMGTLYPVPKDPLALFAQQHRLRANREISKLKRVERKLKRKATSLENMAERVAAARQIKERELRKFEKELAEARP